MTQEIKQRIEQLRLNKTPDGYKKTTVGVIPQEWEVINLSDISEYKTRKNVENIKYPTFTNSATEGIIKQTDYFDKKISNDENISGYYLVNENDFVYNPRISVSAPCGPINCSHIPETGIMSPLYTVFKLLKGKEFYEFFFHSSIWYKYMCSVANYGARSDRMNITNNDFFKMPLCQPPLAEQQKIAAILSTQDKVIELQQKKIDELKKLKKAYLSKMFPQKGSNVPELRFKGFTGNWEQRKFSETFDFLQNNTLSRAELNMQNGKVKNVHYGDVLIKFGEFTDVQNTELSFISDDNIADKYSSAKLNNGDIVIADTAEDETVGKCTEIGNIGTIPVVSGLHTMPCRPKEDFAEAFLGFFMNSTSYHDQLFPFMQGIKVSSISKSSIQETVIKYPKDKAEQQKIGSFFRTLDNIITLQSRKLDAEKLKKKSLMQLLLTGIVRVK